MKALESEIEPTPRGMVAEGEVAGRVDPECANKALTAQFGDIDYAYVDAENGSYPTYIYYRSPDQAGYAQLVVRGTFIHHEFYGYRHPLPQADFPPAITAMRKAAEAIKAMCGVDLSQLTYREVGQRVDALH